MSVRRLALLWGLALAVGAGPVVSAKPSVKASGAPGERRVAVVLRLTASAESADQPSEAVPDPRASPGLTARVVGVPRIEGGRCRLRLVISNASDRVVYHPRVRLERRAKEGGEAIAVVAASEASSGLRPVSISKEIVATIDLALLGDLPADLLAIAESAPVVVGSIGTHGITPGAFSKPRGIAIDAKGRIVVADRGNNRVQVLSATGKSLQSWGSLGTAPEQFDHPEDVEIDARSGRIHVCDMNNGVIKVLSPRGDLVATYPTDGTDLNHPSDLALAPDGAYLYVADSGHSRIVRFDAQGRSAGGWGEFGEAPGQFRAILDVETDAQGRVYVSDGSNASVQVFTPDGRLLARLGRGTAGADHIRYPTAVVPLPGDRVLVSDFSQDRVTAFALSGTFLGEFGHAGNALGDFQYPNDMALEGSRLFVSQTASDAITIFDLEGWSPFDGDQGR